MNTYRKNRKGRMLAILATVAAALLILTSCTDTASTDTTDQQNNQTEEVTTNDDVTTATEDNTVNHVIVATELSDDDLTLSLEGYGSKGALADTDLTIMDMLTYAVQDEYLAHGEYVEIIAEYGDNAPYSNIVEAEAQHLASLKTIYDAYGFTFPEDDSADHLVVPASLLEAAETGVQAEIDNIDMYELFLTYELPDDIRAVFESLMTASESHLQAFQKQVDKLS